MKIYQTPFGTYQSFEQALLNCFGDEKQVTEIELTEQDSPEPEIEIEKNDRGILQVYICFDNGQRFEVAYETDKTNIEEFGTEIEDSFEFVTNIHIVFRRFTIVKNINKIHLPDELKTKLREACERHFEITELKIA